MSHKEGTVSQRWKEMAIMHSKVLPHVLVCGQLEVFAADCNRDDRGIAQRGDNTTASQGTRGDEGLVVLDDYTVDCDNKGSSIPWTIPPVIA